MSLVIVLSLFFVSNHVLAAHLGSQVVAVPPPVVMVPPVEVPVPVEVKHEVALPVAPVPVVDKSHDVASIIAGGTKLAKVTTAGLVAPFVFGASKISGAAGMLPPILAANGAILGSIIAVPIQVSASLASGLVSGITGFLVGIPVGIGTGVAAGLAGAKEHLHSGVNYFETQAIPVSKDMLLKPLALIAGGKAYVLGAGIKIIGHGIEGVGNILRGIGAHTEASGLKLKGGGAAFVAWGLGGKKSPILLIPVETPSNSTLTE